MAQTTQATSDISFQFITDLGAELSSGNFDIPAFPDNAVRITNALEDPDISADQAAKVIGSDPVFSARLLKVANSVLVNGAGVHINDLRTAIARMGFKQAYNTVMSVAIEQVMYAKTTQKLRPHLQQLWHHSVQVAAYAYVIAKKQTRINPDVALLAGLLHDIGKFYILTRADSYPGFLDDVESLEHVMQEWHTGVGRGIIEAWGLSEDLALVADEHEVLDRNTDGADLVDVVIVANLFSHQVEADDDYEADWEGVHAMHQLNLTAEAVANIYNDYHEEIESMILALQG